MRELINQLFAILHLPSDLGFVIWALVLFGAASVVAQVAVVFMVLMERKVLAWITQRKGPNRVGPYGALQTLADGIKLLFKEVVYTPEQDKILYTLGPVLFLFPVFVVYLLLPFTNMMNGLNLTVSLLLYFAISSLGVLGIVLSGWASNNKYSLLGGMRSAAQAISYEIPLIMAAMSVALAAGSVNLIDIVEAQNSLSQGVFSWNFLALLPVGGVIFYIASIAEVNRIPFDLPEAESELVSGYNTEYSGMNFAMFFLAEYAALFGMSALTAILFFGGYYSPLGGLLLQKFFNIQDPLLLQLEMATWMIFKTYFFIALAMLLRGTLPRLKPDQLMGFSWKFLMPLSLVNLLVVAMLKYSWTQKVIDWVLPVLGFKLNGYYLVSYALCVLLILAVFSLFGAVFYTGVHKRQRQINQSAT